MAKIIELADIHFGYPERLQHLIWAMRVADEYAARNDITTAIILGDLFHNRVSLDIDALCAAHEFFSKAKRAGRQYICFPGNHDMFLKHDWRINSVRPLSEVITYIDSVKIIDIDGRRFWVLPFIQNERSYMKVLEAIEEQYQDGDVLLTHIGTTDAIKNVCFMLKEWSVVDFRHSKFKEIHTGHFHAHQVVGGKVIYVGSPIPFKADEGDCEHGFIVYDTETSQWEFKDVFKLGAEYFPQEPLPPQYFTILLEDLPKVDKQHIEGNIIRVVTDNNKTPAEKTEIIQSCGLQEATKVNWMTVASEEVIASGQVITKSLNLTEQFDEWLIRDEENIKAAGLSITLLKKIDSDIRAIGDERYEASRADNQMA